MKKLIAVLLVLTMALTMAACGEEKETTLTGMVVSVEGTTVSLIEMDATKLGSMDFSKGERPEMPEGMESFQGFGDFNPEDFNGSFPEGEGMPQWGEGEMPQMPEGMTPPEGMERPENGEMPIFGENGGFMPGFGSFLSEDMETQTVEIGNAHISVERDGVKASGSVNDIKAGTMITVTINGKGKVTHVLVTSQFSFGGGRRNAN